MPKRPLVHRIYSLSKPLRRRRMQRFLSAFPEGEVLDAGGSLREWEGTGRTVTVLNVREPAAWDVSNGNFIRGEMSGACPSPTNPSTSSTVTLSLNT